ncbi:hypothetical protein [Kribbella sp. CA-293567]|uniref:hypothetical protein n=1 Tax=Kribbella sp. CA-293567 TaxID=3002436 RepID=UPI0022DD3637|nr:hypothetical protein [Kribbella sp. CA-293567]WBQ03039.1 hypothetical protein OX958_24015 [Kribbella sp. CA-293567]
MSSARRRPGVAARPGPLEWTDLKRDDRIQHFEYGKGTVLVPGPAIMHVCWDKGSRVDTHTPAIARFFTLLGPDDEPVT